MVRVERIKAEQGMVLKAVRCRALEEAPYAFSSTLEGALQRSEESWMLQARESAEGNEKAMFLAYAGEETCGLMGCLLAGEKREIADLYSVWVAPEFRRLGVAHRLLESALDWARQGGARLLHAWVAETNTGAIAFYKSVGMRETGEREAMREGGEEEQILLTMGL